MDASEVKEQVPILLFMQRQGIELVKRGRDYKGLCPFHDDHHPSFHVSTHTDRYKCFACGASGDIFDYLKEKRGLTLPDAVEEVCRDYSLNGHSGAANGGTKPKAQQISPNEFWKKAQIFDYTDEYGKIIYQVGRLDFLNGKKDFRQRRPTGNSFAYNLEGVRKLLYKLPDVVDAIKIGCRIWIVEGELCVHGFEQVCEVATTCSGGADRWTEEHALYFEGAKEIIIVQDRDDAGRKHAEKIFDSLKNRVENIWIMEAGCPTLDGCSPGNDKADSEDHFSAGLGLEDFKTISKKERRFQLLTPAQVMALPPKEWLVDKLFGPGDLGMIYGQKGTAKSFILLDLICACATADFYFAGEFQVNRPCRVVYCTGEKQGGLGQRMQALFEHREPGELAQENIRIVQRAPQLFMDSSVDFVDAFCAELDRDYPDGFDLLVIDTLARAAVGADENEARDAGIMIHNAATITERFGNANFLAHHSGRQGSNPRGSSAWDGACDTMIEVIKTEDGRYCRCEKSGDSSDDWKLAFDLVPIHSADSCAIKWTGRPSSANSGLKEEITAILKVSAYPLDRQQIRERLMTESSPNSVSVMLNRLVADGSSGISSSLRFPSKAPSARGNPSVYEWLNPGVSNE